MTIDQANAARQAQVKTDAEAVAFINKSLGGRDDPDGKLLTAAAMAWVWHGRGDADRTEDEAPSMHPAYGRERYFGALRAYAAFKNRTKVKTKKK